MMLRMFLSVMFVCALVAAPAQGAFVPPFGPAGGGPLQGVLDGITVGGPSSVNVLTEGVSESIDSFWQVNGGTGSISTIVVELAGFAGSNTFGIFDMADSSKTVEIFAGAASSGATSILQILADGSIFVDLADTGEDFAGNAFGYYLDSSANVGGGFWYSDTSLNSDGTDHMVAYQGQGDMIEVPPFAAGPWAANQYILAFEDLEFNGPAGYDGDFTDFVVLVESVSPIVPEPASVMTWLGLFGAIGLVRSRRSSRR